MRIAVLVLVEAKDDEVLLSRAPQGLHELTAFALARAVPVTVLVILDIVRHVTGRVRQCKARRHRIRTRAMRLCATQHMLVEAPVKLLEARGNAPGKLCFFALVVAALDL